MMQAVTCACVFRSRYLGHRTIFFQGTLSYVLNNGLAFSKVRSTNVSEHRHKLKGSYFTVKTGLKAQNQFFFSLPPACTYSCNSCERCTAITFLWPVTVVVPTTLRSKERLGTSESLFSLCLHWPTSSLDINLLCLSL